MKYPCRHLFLLRHLTRSTDHRHCRPHPPCLSEDWWRNFPIPSRSCNKRSFLHHKNGIIRHIPHTNSWNCACRWKQYLGIRITYLSRVQFITGMSIKWYNAIKSLTRHATNSVNRNIEIVDHFSKRQKANFNYHHIHDLYISSPKPRAQGLC